MRLIDADALIGELRDLADKNYEKTQCYMGIIGAIGRVQDAPIAYDIEKVVAEIRRCSGNGYRDVDGDYVPSMINTKNAIDIVRKGGVE